MSERLTDTKVASKRPKKSCYSVADTGEPGLELRVHPTGRRTFALRASVNGKDVRMALGAYPTMTLAQARIQAAERKLRLRTEGDFRIAEQVKRAQRTYTVTDLAADWESHAKTRIRSSTLDLHRQRLRSHILPAIGHRPLDMVKRADIRDLANRLAGEGAVVTANRVVSIVSVLYRFARRELERDVVNPASDWQKFPEKERERVLSEEEIRIFWPALDDPDLPPGPQLALALKIALLTAQRIGEVIGARDCEFDFQERMWRVPEVRLVDGEWRKATKGGRENLVPLTPALLSLIRQAQSLRGRSARNAPLFPSPTNPDISIRRHSASRGMGRLCEKIGLAPASPHDLRRTARTLLSRERLGVTYETRERLLSHVTGSKASQVYDQHDFLPEKRRALEKLNAEMDRILNGSSMERADDVSPPETLS